MYVDEVDVLLNDSNKKTPRNSLIANNTKLTISLYIQSLSICLIQKIFAVGMEASREGKPENSPGLSGTLSHKKRIQASSTHVPLTEHPGNLALKFKASCGHEVLLHKSSILMH